MKTCKITVLRKVFHEDLAALYENRIEHACDLQEGQVFYSVDGCKPAGMCDAAWETLISFVHVLALGGGDFYDGWMKNPHSAVVSCNDGIRPVSFLVETVEEGSAMNN